MVCWWTRFFEKGRQLFWGGSDTWANLNPKESPMKTMTRAMLASMFVVLACNPGPAPEEAECGDGKVDAGEQCDDGNELKIGRAHV